MPGKQCALVGRDAELQALGGDVETSGLVLVRGGAGVGKTALLRELRHRAQNRGIHVVSFGCGTDIPEWDEFATSAVIESVRDDFRRIGGSQVAAALAAVVRGSAPETYASVAGRSALFADLVGLFCCLRGKGAVAVLADDVHVVPNPGSVVSAARQAGCAVVATCRADAGAWPVPGRILDLAPLPDAEVDTLLAALAGGRMDEAVAPAVRNGLGALAGNPGAVCAVFRQLERDGRFAEVQDHLCLADPDAPITLPGDHELVRYLARFGEVGAQLVALAHRMDWFGVDDLPRFARATGRDPDACGLVADELVTAGVLDADDQGNLSVSCPALVHTVLPAGMAAVHRAVAEYLMRESGAFPPAPAVVADHIALAGPALPPDPAAAALLEREAAQVRRSRPVAAARWYRAAPRHCAPGSATHTRLLDTAVRLLVEVGDYRSLGELVAEAVTAGFAEDMRYELAFAAALAAVHLGVPVPEPVRATLAAEASGRAPLEFAASFAGDSTYSFDGAQLQAVFGAFRGAGSVSEDWARGIEVAGDQHDILTLLRLLVGPGYGEPAVGQMAVFGRLIRNFTRGEWAGIPSDARRLELADGVWFTLKQSARMIAAEVHSALGEPERAEQWLAKVDAGFPYRASRAWVEIGIPYRAGDLAAARERGWARYPDVVGGPVFPGDLAWLRCFLVRMGYLEKQAGNVDKLQVLCRDAKRWHARHPGVTMRIAELILRGLAENDSAAAIEAVGILRRQGNRPELMRALVAVAFLAEDPRPWYHEAYEIAQQLGGERLLNTVTTAMRESGIAAPSQRSGVVVLTGDEERIVELIRNGLTNRQIGAAVQMSEKTIENHLTRLFAKTGCRSRLDLATASLDGRLVFTSGSRVF